jgi:hypothetical protein
VIICKFLYEASLAHILELLLEALG